MKLKTYNIKYLILLIVAVFGLGSCSTEDINEPSESELPLVTNYQDGITISVDQTTNYVTFSFDGEGVMPVWIIDGTYSTDFTINKFYRKAGEYSVDVKIANSNGISDGTITETFQIEKSIMSGFGGYDYDSEYNLWKKATVDDPEFYYAPSWSQIADPSYTYSDGAYTINLTEATSETWQAQVKLGSDISTSVNTQYDFSVILTSSTDLNDVVVKLVDGSDDENFYFVKTINLSANEPLCSWSSDMAGIDMTNLRLVLDFGGNSANTQVVIENIVVKDHANDDGTVVPEGGEVIEPNWVDVDSADNLWKGISFTNEFYYAPGWSQIPDPSLTISDNQYTLVFPKATNETWQNQVKFVTESLSTTTTEDYDFKVNLKASSTIAKATIKFVQKDDDDTFLLLKEVELPAGEDVVVKEINAPGVDITQGILVFDFGGNQANTNVTISDVILQVHKD